MDRDQVLFRLFGKYCPEGTILYTEGASGEEAYLVQSGVVRLAPASGDPSEGLSAGALLGEEAFFSRAVRPRRAEVAGDTRLLLLSDRSLDSFVRNGPETAARLTGKLLELAEAGRAALDAWLLAHTLRRAGPHLAGTAAGRVRAADLADQAGASPADIATLLAELERRGAAAREDPDSWRLADAAQLERAARAIAAAGEPS